MLAASALPLLLSGGLTDIDQTLFFSTLVLFALFAGVLSKFGWKPLLKAVEERERGIRDAVQGAEAANSEAKVLLAQHHDLVRAASRERDEILKRALQDADNIKGDLLGKARAEAEQVLTRARQQIEQEKGLAIQDLKAQVADLAIQAAARIVESSLDQATQRKLVSDFIEQLPKSH